MTDEELLELAKQASKKAYCKYSGFSVGAALMCEDGRVFTGCNIENGSYSLTICAERTAIFKAVSEGCKRFPKIAIVGGARGDLTKPCYPCGACLQVMSEFCNDDFKIVLTDKEHSLKELLPARFEMLST
ncbi:MAG: cytidine deaminase [Ruminococcus sp.]|nr:cytidine deaminase [Ruminococcus sp.]